DAGVGDDVEVHAQLHLAARALVERVHVEHLVHTAHLLLDGRGDRLLERHRVGPRVARGEEDLGWRDVRVERDGQLSRLHEPDDHHEDGDHHGDDGAVDEEACHDAAYFVARLSADASDASRTFWPARTRSPPSTITRSPGPSPCVTIQSEPTRASTLTG